MTRTKYEVWKGGKVSAVYVNEKRNAEDMLQQIIKKHQLYDEFGKPKYLKIIREVGGERKIIYTPSMNKFWVENLVD